MKKVLLLIFISVSTISFSQQKRKIKILNVGYTYDSKENPNITIFLKDVYLEIGGATIRCERAEMYNKTNYLKAMGNVVLNQGDTIIQTSDFADYYADTKLAQSWGNVRITDPTMVLTSDRVFFDREKQYLYYNEHATIKDSINVLKSKVGNYYLKNNKFQALNKVVITNPNQVIETNNLEYYTSTGMAFLHGPSTITGEGSVVYTEEGFHDTKTTISHLTKNSKIHYEDRTIFGDSLYYHESKSFASATGNIKVIDTINNSILKGEYGEFFQLKDSAFITGRAVAISLIEKDSMYIHGDKLLITGKPENRIVRAYSHVKFFKSDIQGKCDSLYSNQVSGLTKMFRRPILWAEGNQITGDIIHFLSNPETEQLDSLKVLGNAFMVQKDSTGYNQTKGRNLFGKFNNNELEIINIIGNGEVFHFIRSEENELIGITKMRCSNINVFIKNNQIQETVFFKNPSGKTYPTEKIHPNDRLLRGFLWRESEKPVDKDDIFRHDEGDDELIAKIRIIELETKIEAQEELELKLKKEALKKEVIRKKDSLNIPNKISDTINPQKKVIKTTKEQLPLKKDTKENTPQIIKEKAIENKKEE